MKSLFFSLLIVTTIINLYAQEYIPASGGNATGSGGSVSYSIGQFVYNTHKGINGSVTEGVHQPYEISVVTGLEESIDINVILWVYPNPTHEFLTLRVKNYDLKNLSYQLFDINGKLLEKKILTSTESGLDMNNHVMGIYFLKVLNKHKEVKTFKIIKD